MVRDDIIEAVEKPTEWISSMVVITKKDSKLRICLDPKDLNRAIRRENYQLPTIEDIATRLHGAKVFTVLDVRHGFWHVCLDDRSSYLTTFHTLFGRYRYKRMPFGIRFRFRFRFIYLVILQTQETSAKTKSGRCRRGHLEKNKVYSIHVCTNISNY